MSLVVRGCASGPEPGRVPPVSPPVLLAVLLLTFGACAPEGGAPPSAADAGRLAPTVVLVTWDTVRADRVGAYGASSGATPRLDALAREGLLVESARAPAPITLVSHASLLTGLQPAAHGVRDNGSYRLAAEHVSLPERLAAAGWRTGAFVGAFVLDAKYGLDQGFEVYGTPEFRRLGLPLQGAERPAARVVDEALAWVDGVRADAPVFLWAHFYEPHLPYAPPAAQASRFADPYDGELAECDEQLGRLLEGLDAAGRAGARLVIVTSDHGEAFGEHGEQTHGVFVYDATQRVPLVLHGRGIAPGRLTGPASLVDVAPTVLDWAGLPRPPGDGVSLLGGRALDVTRALPLESWLPWHAHGWMPQRALVWNDYKYVAARVPELYALRDDPAELRNLYATLPEVAAACERRLEALPGAALPAPAASALPWTGDDLDRLVALGYVSGGVRAGDALQAPDPRERLPQLEARDRALRALWAGRVRLGLTGTLALDAAREVGAAQRAEGLALVEAALLELHALRAEAPDDPGLLELIGLAEVSRGRWEAAVTAYSEHLLAQPGAATSHFNLAISLERLGETEGARAHMLHALHLEPRATAATRWMAEAEAERNAWGHAAWWYERLREAVGGELDGELAPLEALRSEALSLAARHGQAVAAPDDLPAG